jgi:hypothetical protein
LRSRHAAFILAWFAFDDLDIKDFLHLIFRKSENFAESLIGCAKVEHIAIKLDTY